MNVIFKRRSVRNFQSKPVEPIKLERIIRAGMEAPSAHNRRPWEFLIITDGTAKKTISEMSPYAKMVNTSPVVIATLADLKIADSRTAGGEWWVQDLSACTQNMLLQIVEEELGGVWLGWYPDRERMRAFSAYFHLPAHIAPFSLVALGYPETVPEPEDRFDETKLHYGSYGVAAP